MAGEEGNEEGRTDKEKKDQVLHTVPQVSLSTPTKRLW